MQALTNIRVIDLTQIYQGPYCSFLMAMAGADVIKVEPLTGERTRRLNVSDVPPMNFAMLNSNKRSITLDLKNSKVVEILQALVKESDVLLENFAPGVMDRLGVGYETLKKINPRLIYASGTGYGLSGPDRDLLAMDHTVQADGGLMSTTGERDGPPARAGGTPVDFLGGTHMHAGVMQAIIGREKTGKGTLVECAMIEALYFVLTSQITNVHSKGAQAPRRGDKSGSQTSPYGRYLCKDDKYLVLTAVAETHWERILTVIGREDLRGNPDFETRLKRYARDDEVNDMIEAWTRQHTRDEAISILRARKIAAAPVRDVAEVMEDPHMHSRGMLQRFEHPVMGDIILPQSPINLSAYEMSGLEFYPQLGEHNREVLGGLLGISDSDIDILVKEGVILSPTN
ncbi:MAG: CoA transferase [Rhodospirillaceae bacterium]|nr:CoA transferase [Rhodospirillaceae bacterium]